jgi:hypothetical protein
MENQKIKILMYKIQSVFSLKNNVDKPIEEKLKIIEEILIEEITIIEDQARINGINQANKVLKDFCIQENNLNNK